MNRLTFLSLCALVALASPVASQPVRVAVPAAAPQGAAACAPTALRQERLSENHVRLTGNPVEIDCPDMKFYAEAIELVGDRVIATGNVVYTSATNQIGADRVEYDMKTRIGKFFNASGTAAIASKADKSMFGTQEPDVYFYGELIEKRGDRTYRISKGAFTTCVQPTPRWEIVSSEVTLTLDAHAVLKNAVLKVKNVPLFYFPVMYYPLEEDDRATGFLIPTYGVSTFRGQTLSNAFFWAVNRSQDVTLFHDWYSKTGQGFGGEYRYAAAPGSDGSVRMYFLREHEATIDQPGLGSTLLPARRSYELRGGASHSLPGNLRAQANVDYFSDLAVLQTYYNNIYDTSRRTRSFTGLLSGTWGRTSVSGGATLSQIFYDVNYSANYGNLPRVSFSQSQTQLGRSPLFVGLNVDYTGQLYRYKSGATAVDQSLNRLDAQPVLRVPFKKLSFLTVDSTIAWPSTYYSESLDGRGVQVPVPYWRNYLDMRSEVVGPVLVRIWNTPKNGYAEKFKHIIEPSVQVRYITKFDSESSVKYSSYDFLIGGSMQIRYTLTNRLLARRRQKAGVAASREILSGFIYQTFYADKAASPYDPSYISGFRGRTPSNFSPIAIGVTGSPSEHLSSSLSIEYDPELPGYQGISVRASGGGGWVRASGGLSRRHLAYTYSLDNYVNADVTVREPITNRVGGTFSINYDFGRDLMLQKRFVAYYNAQCCGIAVEYQTYNFPTYDPRVVIPQDRRFNISFSLAGIGTFSNFFGALTGTPDRR